MKLEIELSEERLKERLVEATENIESSAWYEMRQSIITEVSTTLLKDLTQRNHWGKEEIAEEVEKKVMEKVDAVVKNYTEEKLKDYDIEKKVSNYVNSYVRDLIETEADKVLSRLRVVDDSEVE